MFPPLSHCMYDLKGPELLGEIESFVKMGSIND